ncbi:MAG: thermonuclease family protein [Rhodocyclales bacterium]|nr:thermonuclease family protein [Rhodocyclales bacterium]
MRGLWNLLAWVAPLGAILCLSPARAENVTGKVVELVSGDSLVIEDMQGQRHRVRLFAIAAPDSRQPFAAESRRALADLLLGKRVMVEKIREDAYGRLIGKLLTTPAHCATCPPSRDVALAQIEAGLAWWFREERREQTLQDQGYYEYAEFDARTRRIGLWRDESPIPPWEWRKRKGVTALRAEPNDKARWGQGRNGLFALAEFVWRPQAVSQIGAAPAGRSPVLADYVGKHQSRNRSQR